MRAITLYFDVPEDPTPDECRLLLEAERDEHSQLLQFLADRDTFGSQDYEQADRIAILERRMHEIAAELFLLEVLSTVT